MHAPAHIFRDLDSEHLAKVATKSQKHSIFTQYPKDRNCDVCSSGNRCLHDTGSLGLLEKQQAVAAAAAAILRQYIQKQSPCTWRTRSQRGQNLDFYIWMPEMQRGIHLRFSLSVSQKKCDTMIKMNEKRMERGIGMVYSQYWKGNSEINWRKSSRTRLGPIAFILEASRQGWKSVKMKWRIKIHSCDPRVIQVEWVFHQDWWIS